MRASLAGQEVPACFCHDSPTLFMPVAATIQKALLLLVEVNRNFVGRLNLTYYEDAVKAAYAVERA